MKHSQQLILSRGEDLMAAAIYWGLKASGLDPVWSTSASFADAAIGPVSLHSNGKMQWRANGSLGASRFTSVLYRWASPREQFHNAQACDLAFVSKEWELFGKNVYALSSELFDAFWVNRPAAAERTENKLVQLRAAAQCGLYFPATLISNDPDQIRNFIGKNQHTIYKPFKPHAWQNHGGERIFHTSTTLLDRTTKLEDDVLRLCPGIYQAYIEKSSDMRVTVIGDRFFPVQIRSSAKARAFVDWRPCWRNDDFYCAPCELPSGYERKLRALMRRLNIVYGAIDLAVDREGKLYFLEVNQIGQCLFVEHWLKSLPLLQAMCAMLAEGKTDYTLATCPGVRYRDYLTSDEHQQWKDTELKSAREGRFKTSHEGQTAGPGHSYLPAGSIQPENQEGSSCNT